MIILKLFISFLTVGLFSVGGGYAAIPLIQSQIVDTFGLLTLSEFTDLITIAEMTPGSIAINSATFVGIRTAGIPGAIICTLGCILPSIIICLLLAYVYTKFSSFSGVQTILGELRPAVVALVASAGLSILILAVFGSDLKSIKFSDFKIVEALLFVGGLVALRKYKVNPIKVIFGTGVIGTIIYSII